MTCFWGTTFDIPTLKRALWLKNCLKHYKFLIRLKKRVF